MQTSANAPETSKSPPKMPPIKEFKFVGGPKRKRRRRQTSPAPPYANKKAPPQRTPSEPAQTTEVKKQHPPSVTVQSDESPPGAANLDTPSTTHNHAHTNHLLLSETPSIQTIPLPPDVTAADSAAPIPLSPSVETDLNMLLGCPNPAGGGNSFTSHFLDAMPMFGSPSYTSQLQLPSFFGPDLDFAHPHPGPQTPSIDSSSEVIMPSDPDHSENGDDPGDSMPPPPHVDHLFDGVDPTIQFTSDEAGGPGGHRPSNYTDTLSRLLTRYNQEFCILPLTNDFAANPFRYNIETGRGSELLLHCILALSYKHLDRDTGGQTHDKATHHKKCAIQMLRDMERKPMLKNFEPTFLDAILILMTLDCATSAHGPWLSYLRRVHRILDATKSLQIPTSPRLKAQIGMLVWWDVTLAMTSRQGCVLSKGTVESIMNGSPEVSSDGSSFYDISGCPKDLFRHMVCLGAYAREFELVSTMMCVSFDMGPVDAAEHAIQAWSPEQVGFSGCASNEDDDSDLAEEAAQYKQDQYHCAEAWRCSLLIYIAKVFKWRVSDRNITSPSTTRGSSGGGSLRFLARKTLNHVASCRRGLMLQKQLLLPVFLAGCEVRDLELRQEALEYCRWWNEKTRYDMFLTAAGLLEEVWTAARDNPDSWWGSIIDQKTAGSTATGPVARQYLFG